MDDFYWGLERIQIDEPVYDNDPNKLLVNGDGVHAYVFDTGVNLRHEEFAGRVGVSYDASNFAACNPANAIWNPEWDAQCKDVNGHGTHVASTILGATAGVAPNATLHSVNVLKGQFGGTGFAMRWGVEWAIRHYEKELKPNGIPAVACASIQGGASTYNDNLFKKLNDAGIFVAVAAGNKDDDACKYSPGRIGGQELDGTLTVAAANVDDSKALYSNWGACTNIWAPGTGIQAAKHSSNTEMTVMSGTSMAAPIVAGVAALAMEAAADPLYTHSGMTEKKASVVKNWILNTALKDKVVPITAGSAIPVAYAQSWEEAISKSQWSERRTPKAFAAEACDSSNEDCALKITPEQSNVNESPNLFVHVPEYLQDIPPYVEPACENEYDEAVYDEQCPATDTTFCGASMGVAPDGTSLERPFRKATQHCQVGCTCDELVKTTYQSCASAETTYTYSESECAPVYMIDSDEKATSLVGKALTWTPLTGGDGYYPVAIRKDAEISPKTMDTSHWGSLFKSGSTYFWQGKVSCLGPCEVPFPDDGIGMISMPAGKPFKYYGKDYSTVYVHNNGFLQFGYAPYTLTVPNIPNHFTPWAGGPRFAALFADWDKQTIYYSVQEKFTGWATGWRIYAVVITFGAAPVSNKRYASGDNPVPPSAFQIRLLFETQEIEVTYGAVAPQLTAVIGPANATGVVPGFDSESTRPKLPTLALTSA
jgi:hypothetical protein